MAQPVLDEQSPLDDYLRESELDLMPGTLPEYCISSESSNDVAPWVPSSVLSFCHSLESLLCPPANQPTGRQFAERFKYIIISSSLLSAFLSPSSLSPPSSRLAETPSSGSDVNHVPITASALLLFLVAPISLASGHWIITILSVLLANFYFNAAPPANGEKPLQTRSTLESLHSLVEADVAWESAIGEAMALLRRDEEASSSIQWQTPLRVALQSSLQAVTVHVDRVRHLFSPLTSPNELAQMSEMYAPPSPTVSHQSLASPDKLRASSTTTPNKRITWSGPSSKQLARRSTDIQGLLFTRPGSPIPPVPRLPQHPSSPSEGSENSFGALDLDIYKNRTTPQRHSLATPRSAGSLRPSPTAVSRFTAMQSMRNPLSMSSMDAALQAALDSKRFACAHLLALRFDEEEDDLYWEDVRAVMSLLSTSLEDETARLSQAMDEWHHARQRDARPSATSTPSPSSEPEAEPQPPRIPRRTHRQLTSFAPSSSQMAKATTHMDSIASALDRAFGQLETCVSSLRQHDASESSELEQNTEAAMSAYESLRRELGLALRECERARSPILSVLNNSSADVASDEEVPLGGGPLDGTPVSGAQAEDDDFPDSPTRAGASSPPPAYVSRGPSQIVDDATAHLLAGATAGELPPFGADRVFEADSETVNAAANNTTSSSNTSAYAKERSTLSRAERIALAQAKRRSTRASQAQTPVYGGTDIVAELKEVISRVNERKQRMAAVAASLPARRASMALDMADFLESGIADAPDGAVLVSTASTVSP